MTVIDTTTTFTADEQRVIDLTIELESFPPADTAPQTFLGEQFDRGLAWVHFPEGHGGLGSTPNCSSWPTSASSAPVVRTRCIATRLAMA